MENNSEASSGIDPKVDYAFKWLFGGARGPDLLIHLLNTILDAPPGEQIVEIEILNPFNEKMTWDDKLSILDIKARDQLGRQFNIEMQMAPPVYLGQRILYYWAKLYTEQMRSGQDYDQLKRTISVCFVDGTVFPKTEEYHTTFNLIDVENGAVLTEDLTIHFFELPKYQLAADEVKTPLEAWLYFLRHAERLDPVDLPEKINTPEIRQAMEELMLLTKVDIQKEIYEGRLKAQRDARALSKTIAQMEKALAQAETERAQAETERVQAETERVQAETERVQAENERAQAENERIQAEARAAAAEARAAEAEEKGIVVGRIQLLEKLLRRTETSRASLETMSLEALTALAARLERDLAG